MKHPISPRFSQLISICLKCGLTLSFLSISPASVFAADWSKHLGKRFTVNHQSGRHVFSGTVKKCRSSTSGFCVGSRKIGSDGAVLAWSGSGEYQWHYITGLGGNCKSVIRYLNKDSSPRAKRPRRGYVCSLK